MFSVGDDSPRFNTPDHVIYAGIEPLDVSYEGDNPNGGLFEFEGPIIRLGYDSGILDLTLGTGGKITGIDDVSYFDVGGKVNTGISLYRAEQIRVKVPIVIASRYVNMTNSSEFQPTFNQFRFGSLTVGGGADLLVRPQENIRFNTGIVPSYGFAFPTGGTFGGSLGSVHAYSRLHFDKLFKDLGLSIGYQYDMRNYDVDENMYDYKMRGHIFEIGVTF